MVFSEVYQSFVTQQPNFFSLYMEPGPAMLRTLHLYFSLRLDLGQVRAVVADLLSVMTDEH